MSNNSYEVYENQGENLKYTTYQIHQEILRLYREADNMKDFCDKYGISEDMGKILVKPCKVYTVSMYEAASKILNKSYDELTEIVEYKVNTKFRKKTSLVSDTIKQDMDFAYSLFEEIITNMKLAE